MRAAPIASLTRFIRVFLLIDGSELVGLAASSQHHPLLGGQLIGPMRATRAFDLVIPAAASLAVIVSLHFIKLHIQSKI